MCVCKPVWKREGGIWRESDANHTLLSQTFVWTKEGEVVGGEINVRSSSKRHFLLARISSTEGRSELMTKKEALTHAHAHQEICQVTSAREDDDNLPLSLSLSVSDM